MKKVLLIAIVLLPKINGFSQRFITQAPQRAQAMLDSLYHDAKDVWWYTDTNATEVFYYAYFIYNRDEIEVVFVWHPQQYKMELEENDVSTGIANIPAAIIHKFDSIFPNAMQVYWPAPIFNEDSPGYRVCFSLYRTGDFTEMRDNVEFDWNGKLIRAFLLTPDSLLPAKMKTYLLAHYSRYALSDWTIIGDADKNGNLGYRGYLHKNPNLIDNITGSIRTVVESFDQQGNPLKRQHYRRSGITDPF